MLQPWFLDIDHTMRLHRSLIEIYGGSEGIRDVGLLHSALAMPQSSFGGGFLHRDLFELAAAYLHHIVQNHPFIDESKRTGSRCCNHFSFGQKCEEPWENQGLFSRQDRNRTRDPS